MGFVINRAVHVKECFIDHVMHHTHTISASPFDTLVSWIFTMTSYLVQSFSNKDENLLSEIEGKKKILKYKAETHVTSKQNSVEVHVTSN